MSINGIKSTAKTETKNNNFFSTVWQIIIIFHANFAVLKKEYYDKLRSLKREN